MVQKNLMAIVRDAHQLTAGRKVLVVLLDYWNVWLGGQYAAARGDAYVAAGEEMTDRVDRVIKSTAAKTGSAYVDLRAAFKDRTTPSTRRTTSPATATTRTLRDTSRSRPPPRR